MADNYIVSAREKAKFKKDLEGLREKTRSDYQGLAANFYAKRLGGEAPTPKRIADALRQAGGDYRPGYWRKLRNALMYDQVDKGYFEAAQRLKETSNPVTTGKTRGTVKTKQRRCKSISDADMQKLSKALNEKKDSELSSVVFIAHKVGCRPAEMAGIKRLSDTEIFVPGAKKSKGNRGLDRTITLDKEVCDTIEVAVDNIRNMDSEKAVHQLQSRLDRLTAKLWPRRKARPTLYTFRHQMGSDLKASGLSRVEIAYVMGHQSTASVDVYGDRRKSSGRGTVKPAPGADMSMVRENHDKAPGPKAPAIKKPSTGFGIG